MCRFNQQLLGLRPRTHRHKHRQRVTTKINPPYKVLVLSLTLVDLVLGRFVRRVHPSNKMVPSLHGVRGKGKALPDQHEQLRANLSALCTRQPRLVQLSPCTKLLQACNAHAHAHAHAHTRAHTHTYTHAHTHTYTCTHTHAHAHTHTRTHTHTHAHTHARTRLVRSGGLSPHSLSLGRGLLASKPGKAELLLLLFQGFGPELLPILGR